MKPYPLSAQNAPVKNIISLLALAWFLVCVFHGITKQPLSFDAWLHGYWASDIIYRFLALIKGFRIENAPFLFEGDFSFLFWPGRQDIFFPLMTCYFTGAPIIYFLLPFIIALGQSTTALTLPFILLSAVNIFLIYRVCSRWLSKTALTAMLVFLCTDPFFIRLSRTGAETETGLQIFGLWSGVLMLIKAGETKKPAWFAGAGLIFGFTIYTKLMFAAYIIAAIVLLCLANYPFRRYISSMFSRRSALIIFVSAFIIGLSPLILYNLKVNAKTLNESVMFILAGGYNYDTPTDEGSFIEANALTRARQIKSILSKDTTEIDSIYLGNSALMFHVHILLLAAMAIWSIIMRKKLRQARTILYFYIFYGTVMLTSISSPNTTSMNHLGVLIPFLHVIKGAAAELIIQQRKKIWLLFLLPLAFDLAHSVKQEITFMKIIDNKPAEEFPDWDRLTMFLANKTQGTELLVQKSLSGPFYPYSTIPETADKDINCPSLSHEPRFIRLRTDLQNPNIQKIWILAKRTEDEEKDLLLMLSRKGAQIIPEHGYPEEEYLFLGLLDLNSIPEKNPFHNLNSFPRPAKFGALPIKNTPALKPSSENQINQTGKA